MTVDDHDQECRQKHGPYTAPLCNHVQVSYAGNAFKVCVLLLTQFCSSLVCTFRSHEHKNNKQLLSDILWTAIGSCKRSGPSPIQTQEKHRETAESVICRHGRGCSMCKVFADCNHCFHHVATSSRSHCLDRIRDAWMRQQRGGEARRTFHINTNSHYFQIHWLYGGPKFTTYKQWLTVLPQEQRNSSH